MTSTELKSSLLTIADILDKTKLVFDGKVDEDILSVLNSLNSTTLNVLATIFRMEVNQITNIAKLLETLHNFFNTPEPRNISAFCRNLANRPFVLFTISKLI